MSRRILLNKNNDWNFVTKSCLARGIVFESTFIHFTNLATAHRAEASKSNVELWAETVHGVISGRLSRICRELLSSNLLVTLKPSPIDSSLELQIVLPGQARFWFQLKQSY